MCIMGGILNRKTSVIGMACMLVFFAVFLVVPLTEQLQLQFSDDGSPVTKYPTALPNQSVYSGLYPSLLGNHEVHG